MFVLNKKREFKKFKNNQKKNIYMKREFIKNKKKES